MPDNPATPARARPRSRYQNLLQLRIRAGCRVIDALCHAQADLAELLTESNLLEDQLEGYKRYRRDYLLEVLPSEEARFHVPGINRPRDAQVTPCQPCQAEASQASTTAEDGAAA